MSYIEILIFIILDDLNLDFSISYHSSKSGHKKPEKSPNSSGSIVALGVFRGYTVISPNKWRDMGPL